MFVDSPLLRPDYGDRSWGHILWVGGTCVKWIPPFRELQNWLRFAHVRSRGQPIAPEHLPPTYQRAYNAVDRGRRRKLTVASVREALARTGGNKVEAARQLGVSRATLYRFLDREQV